MEDDFDAAMMMLPPPPPPPHIKLLQARCMDCVISYLDDESTKSMARSCRFFREACSAADLTPLMGAQHLRRSDAASVDALEELSVHAESSQDLVNDVAPDGGVQALVNVKVLPSSFDAPLDELSHTDSSQDLVNMQDDDGGDGGDIAFISDNPAPSFDERDEKKSAALPSSDDRNLNRPIDHWETDEGGHYFGTNQVISCVDQSTSTTDSISVNTPVSFSSTIVTEDLCKSRNETMVSLHAANGMKTAENEGAEELSVVVSPSAGNTFYTFDSVHKQEPLSVHSLKSIHTPKRERQTWESELAYTPSTKCSSNSDDSETANHVDEIISEDVQSADHNSDRARSESEDDDAKAEGVDNLKRTTAGESVFLSSFSDIIGDIFGSAKEVANVLVFDRTYRRIHDIDDPGPIKLGEKLYSHNEALKAWKQAKINLEETYKEVDESGNERFDATAFFEESIMYKEKTAKMEEKKSKVPTKQQGGDMSVAQEKRLNKMMMNFSLQEEAEAVIDSSCVDSDNTSNGSTGSTLSSSDQSYSDTSSFGRSNFNPSISARLPKMRPVTPINEDVSVATPGGIDSVLGSNYGVEVQSSCCKFVSGKAEPQLIKDARGYKETEKAPKPVPTRKPRSLANHGLRRRSSNTMKEDKKKSSRSLRLLIKKKSTK